MTDTEGSGADAQTDKYTYYLSTEVPFTASGSLPPLKQVQRADGTWEYYSSYDSNGRPLVVLYGIDSGPTSSASQARRMTYDYTPLVAEDDGTESPRLARTETESYKGNPVAKTFRVVKPGQTRELRCNDPSHTYSQAATNSYTQRTVTVTDIVTGRPVRTEHPDGTVTIYTHTVDAQTQMTTDTSATGKPDSNKTAIVSGTKTITVTGNLGQTISATTEDTTPGQANVVLARQLFENFDEFGRAQRITYLDGSFQEQYHNCCDLGSMVDRDGVTSVFAYDALKRRTATIRGELVTGQDYDAAGRVIRTWRQPNGQGQEQLSATKYSTAGRVLFTTNALGGVTGFVETRNATTGQRTNTIISYTDMGTRVESYYQDGTLAKVTGSGTLGLRYPQGYGSSGRSRGERRLLGSGADSSEYYTVYTDSLGREYKTTYPDSSYSQFSFNTNGQLWKVRDPDGVITFHAYNEKGERDFTVVPVNSGTLTYSYTTLCTKLQETTFLGGNDRITKVVRSVLPAGSGFPDRIQVDTLVWTNGLPNGILLSRSVTAANGTESWNTVWGRAGDETTRAETHTLMPVPDRGNRTRTVTVIAPDSTRTVTVYSNGLILSVTRQDASSSPVTSTTFHHDTQGRRDRIQDALNGITEFTFNAADQVVTVTTPDPGTGRQTTTTYYDTLGRVTGTRYPDNTSVTNFYLQNGLLQKSYGSREYPVGYSYDYAGRKQTMTNWSTFNLVNGTGAGARVTTWNYHTQRGWPISKYYPDPATGNPSTVGPSYTYTSAGRLKTRSWARLGTNSSPIMTTNTYGFEDTTQQKRHGDLLKITYSTNDTVATPSVTYDYDRLGRRSQVVFNGTTTTLTYNNAGQPLTEAHSGGTLGGFSVTAGYNSKLQRGSLSVSGVGEYNLSYAYDTAGRLWTVSDTVSTFTYGYVPSVVSPK